MKLVINTCYGGFGLSTEAKLKYLQLKTQVSPDSIIYKQVSWFDEFYVDGKEIEFYDRDLERNDPVLIEVVELLGAKASGEYSNLKIVEIPDDVEWYVEEYDGMEHIAEQHRTWY